MLPSGMEAGKAKFLRRYPLRQHRDAGEQKEEETHTTRIKQRRPQTTPLKRCNQLVKICSGCERNLTTTGAPKESNFRPMALHLQVLWRCHPPLQVEGRFVWPPRLLVAPFRAAGRSAPSPRRLRILPCLCKLQRPPPFSWMAADNPRGTESSRLRAP